MNEDLTRITLLERLGQADNEAWHEFHDLYSPLILSWLVRRGVQQADAEDLRQDVMVIAFRELPEFKHSGRPGAFRNWLRTAVSNRLRDFYRKARRRPLATGGDDYHELAKQLADPHSQLSAAWNQEYSHVVRERLLRLIECEFDPRTVLAFRRTAIEDRNSAEVAAELEMSINAVQIAKSRVLKRLKEFGRGVLD